MREEVTGAWRKLYNEEFHNLHDHPNIIGVNNSRRVRLAVHVVRIGEMTNTYRTSIGES
jgi:hypothetical protein